MGPKQITNYSQLMHLAITCFNIYGLGFLHRNLQVAGQVRPCSFNTVGCVYIVLVISQVCCVMSTFLGA